MNETILLWILGVLVLSLASIAGIMWRHVEHCKMVHSRLAEIATDLKHVMADIGTHETGIRGTVHKTANTVTDHEGRLAQLEWRDRR